METLTINFMNKVEAMQNEAHFSIVEVIDAETKRIVGYVYEKDLIKFWKGRIVSPTPKSETNY